MNRVSNWLLRLHAGRQHTARVESTRQSVNSQYCVYLPLAIPSPPQHRPFCTALSASVGSTLLLAGDSLECRVVRKRDQSACEQVKGQQALAHCDWEGNRRSGIVLAMRYNELKA